MKKILLIILFIIPSIGLAQDSLTYANQNFSVGLRSQIWGFRPYIGFQFGRHQISAGPYINNPPQYNLDYLPGGYHYYISPPSNFRFVGASLNYRIYPFKPQRIVSFYTENHLGYSEVNLFVNNHFHQKNRQIGESVLAGVELKFLKRFSFWTSAGLGVDFNFGKDRIIEITNSNTYVVFEPVTLRFDLYLGLQIGLF